LTQDVGHGIICTQLERHVVTLRVDPKTPICIATVEMDPKTGEIKTKVKGIEGYRPAMFRLGVKALKKTLAGARYKVAMENRSLEDNRNVTVMRTNPLPMQDIIDQQSIAASNTDQSSGVGKKAGTLASKVEEIGKLEDDTITKIAQKKANG